MNILVLMKDDLVTVDFAGCFFGLEFVWDCVWVFRFVSPIIDDLEFRRDSLFEINNIFYEEWFVYFTLNS
jgi:hypothetical protein